VFLSPSANMINERVLEKKLKVLIRTVYIRNYYFFIIILNGLRLSPLGTTATAGLLYQPHMR
jgi:hypothetical protein